MKLVTAAGMRDLEAKAVEAGTSLDALMEEAGLAVAQEAWLALGVVAGRRVVVLCGPGNNGGDGLVAARHLADWLAEVSVFVIAPRDVGDAKMASLAERNVAVIDASSDDGASALREALAPAELVVDAMLGTGRRRPIEGQLATVLRRLRERLAAPHPPKVIAVDLPTGVDADSGRADPLAVRADLTVTFGLAKVGLYTLPGSEYAGRVQVVDIGLPKDASDAVQLELLDTPWVRARLPQRPNSANKGTFGRVLVVAGSSRYVGAARLAAEACYRVGAGLVTVACTERVQAMLAPTLAEATWLPLDEGSGSIAASSIDAIREQLASYDVLLIGPGLGQASGTGELVDGVLAGVPDNVRACVVDADALNALARIDGWQRRGTTPRVLTPHPGEMARLLGSTVAAVQDDRLGVATKAAADWGHVVVLKGAHTVIAAPDGRAAISPHSNPLLASAGTGDVLAGAIAGLLAQGLAPFEAAACGVYLHGFAAEELEAELGDRGLLASDLLSQLPRVARVVLRGRPMPPMPFGDLGTLGNPFGIGTSPTDAPPA
ncbi:MAG: NAD(P)H-hydrate dehydratase [Dehalococcoidia bacterium]|nr:MAG: NAD(P)H-hydrate dehydratase [Dehalococcoidia bacterium]